MFHVVAFLRNAGARGGQLQFSPKELDAVSVRLGQQTGSVTLAPMFGQGVHVPILEESNARLTCPRFTLEHTIPNQSVL